MEKENIPLHSINTQAEVTPANVFVIQEPATGRNYDRVFLSIEDIKIIAEKMGYDLISRDA